MSGGKGKDERIQVYVRIRCLIGRERGKGRALYTEGGNTIHVEHGEKKVAAKYDRVFDQESTQAMVYEHVRDCTHHVVDGYNSTLFAYGQTGSGKTYTLFGPENEANLFNPAQPHPKCGIIPRAIRDVFSLLKEREASGTTKYSVFCSFLQVYNENVFDLLTDDPSPKALPIHETEEEGVFVEGLAEFLVASPSDCLSILARGEQNRAVRETYMNQNSSRSHSIFQLQVERQESGASEVQRTKLNLVDLAGSEKWNLDVDIEQAHINEMNSINLSLHTLGRCIAALAKAKGSTAHVPYRESKLTRLLKDSLGGNARTRVLAALSPSVLNVTETINTLQFADSAARVMTHSRMNVAHLPDRILVKKLQLEVDRLRSLIMADDGQVGEGGSGQGTLARKVLKLEGDLEKTQKERAELQSRLSEAEHRLRLLKMRLEKPQEPASKKRKGGVVSSGQEDTLGSVFLTAGNNEIGEDLPSQPNRERKDGFSSDQGFQSRQGYLLDEESEVGRLRRQLELVSQERDVYKQATESAKAMTNQFFDLTIEEDQLQYRLSTLWQTVQQHTTRLQANLQQYQPDDSTVRSPLASPQRAGATTSPSGFKSASRGAVDQKAEFSKRAATAASRAGSHMSVRSVDSSKAEAAFSDSAAKQATAHGKEWDRRNCTSPIQTHRQAEEAQAMREKHTSRRQRGGTSDKVVEEGANPSSTDSTGEEEDTDVTPRSPQPVKLPPAVSPSKAAHTPTKKATKPNPLSPAGDDKLPKLKGNDTMAQFQQSSSRMEFLSRLSGRGEEEEDKSNDDEEDDYDDALSPSKKSFRTISQRSEGGAGSTRTKLGSTKKDRARARLGLSPSKAFASTAGRSSRRKGQQSLGALHSASSALNAEGNAPGKGLTMRVRGKAGKTQFVEAGKEKEEAMRKMLTEAYKEMEKQKQLQEWLERKARKQEEEALQKERHHKKLAEEAKKKEEMRKRRAKKLKKMLEEKKAEEFGATERAYEESLQRQQLEAAKEKKKIKKKAKMKGGKKKKQRRPQTPEDSESEDDTGNSESEPEPFAGAAMSQSYSVPTYYRNNGLQQSQQPAGPVHAKPAVTPSAQSAHIAYGGAPPPRGGKDKRAKPKKQAPSAQPYAPEASFVSGGGITFLDEGEDMPDPTRLRVMMESQAPEVSVPQYPPLSSYSPQPPFQFNATGYSGSAMPEYSGPAPASYQTTGASASTYSTSAYGGHSNAYPGTLPVSSPAPSMPTAHAPASVAAAVPRPTLHPTTAHSAAPAASGPFSFSPKPLPTTSFQPTNVYNVNPYLANHAAPMGPLASRLARGPPPGQ